MPWPVEGAGKFVVISSSKLGISVRDERRGRIHKFRIVTLPSQLRSLSNVVPADAAAEDPVLRQEAAQFAKVAARRLGLL